MKAEAVIAEKLLEIGAVKLSPDNPFTWASGMKSPIYCDNRRALSFPIVRDLIKSEFCSVIFEKFPEVDGLAGVATAGIPWGAMAADQMKLPFIYVRPKPKEHGLGNQIEGEYKTGTKLLVIEDLVSTGKSSLEVCRVLQQAGVVVAGLLAIFTYGFHMAEQAFAEANIPMLALSNYDSLINRAAEKKLLSGEEMNSLLKWRQDPHNWLK